MIFLLNLRNKASLMLFRGVVIIEPPKYIGFLYKNEFSG